jgi:hypothetical protein
MRWMPDGILACRVEADKLRAKPCLSGGKDEPTVQRAQRPSIPSDNNLVPHESGSQGAHTSMRQRGRQDHRNI